MAKQSYKPIRLVLSVDKLLTEMSINRKLTGSAINTKQGIVAELIEQAYKKEIECK